MKISEFIECPNCGVKDSYTFYDNEKIIECNHCNKPMDIELETVIKVIATKPIRTCEICEKEFESNEVYEDKVICPHCGN